MINIDKKDTFRACQYYKTNANVKQYVKNEYNEAKRITDKVGRKFIEPNVVHTVKIDWINTLQIDKLFGHKLNYNSYF